MALAVLGDKPKFDKPLYIIKPYLPDKLKLYKIIDSVHENRILTNDGPYVKTFERKLAKLLKLKYVVLTSSGTIGLQLLLKSLNIKGRVMVPSFTFVATVHCLVWEGLEPVFIDIDPESLTINPSLLEEYFTKDVSAVIGVHLFGNPCAVDELEEFCRKKKIKLIFDAAQALGSSYKGKPIGSFGDAEVFSLHATKIINSFEGGFITTNDYDIYKKLIHMRNFGFSGYDWVESIGINAKMNEFSAAVGLTALDDLKDNIKKNKKNHILYNSILKKIPGLRFFKVRKGCLFNYNNYKILVTKEFGLSRDQLCDIFWKENIIARRYYFPGCHRFSDYRKYLERNNYSLEKTEAISNSIICLPCFPDIGENNIDIISKVIIDAYNNRRELVQYYKNNKINSLLRLQYNS